MIQHHSGGGHSGQNSNAHSNYVDDNINIQDYSNTNHRKQSSNQANATPGNQRNQSKTSIEQNNYYFQNQQQMHSGANTSHGLHLTGAGGQNGGDGGQHNRKSSKSKMRHSQNTNIGNDRQWQNQFNLVNSSANGS